jgi:hypothetical protein
MLKGAIKGSLCVCREATSRKLSHPEMVRNALAAKTFPGTGFIGAVTSLKVLFLLAFHGQPSLQPVHLSCCFLVYHMLLERQQHFSLDKRAHL